LQQQTAQVTRNHADKNPSLDLVYAASVASDGL